MPSPNPTRRPRQNSVFVGTSTMAFYNPPRRVKSAIDIQHMVLNEHRPSITAFNSMLPIIPQSRRPSITIERPPSSNNRHRPSVVAERPHISHYQQFRNRRPSCFLERSVQRHRNFISFEHPFDRKKSLITEKLSCSLHQPTISFESHNVSTDSQPTVIVNHPPPSTERRTSLTAPKISKSFEQPSRGVERPTPPRLSVSLDVNSISFERRPSIAEEERESPVAIILDESQITAPLLESLKSSDV